MLADGCRILVTRLQYLGDILLTLPLVYALKRRFPNCEVDYLAKRPGVELLKGEPAIAALHQVPGGREGPRATYRLVQRLRGRRYAVAFDLLSNPRSAWLVYASGSPVRIGGTRRVRRHLYTHAIRVPPGVRSAIAHHLYFLSVLGIDEEAAKPALTIAPEEEARARELLAASEIDMRKLKIGIHPGGKWEVKRWPVEAFAELVFRIKRNFRADVVIFRGPEDAIYTDQLKRLTEEQAVCLPVLPVRTVAAVMHTLDAGVYCDGAAMHLSVAVGTPTVGIFGSSEPDIWFPYESFGPYRAAWIPISCRPCHIHSCDHLSCLRSLSADDVERQLAVVLARSESSVRAADS